jgi:arsenate reductase
MYTLYGIKNCDTVKKARKWLENHAIDYQFHDFRTDGLTPEIINNWFEAVDWESLVNRRSTSWRQLNDSRKEGLNQQSAATLLLENPTLIKRPVLDTGREILVGFSAEHYSKATS